MRKLLEEQNKKLVISTDSSQQHIQHRLMVLGPFCKIWAAAEIEKDVIEQSVGDSNSDDTLKKLQQNQAHVNNMCTLFEQ